MVGEKMASFTKRMGGGAKAHTIREAQARHSRIERAKQRIRRQQIGRAGKPRLTARQVAINYLNWVGEELLNAQHTGYLSEIDSTHAALALNELHRQILGKSLFGQKSLRQLSHEAHGGLLTQREVNQQVALWQRRLSDPKLHRFLMRPHIENAQSPKRKRKN